MRRALAALEARYAGVPKAGRPHPDLGDWWALYDYGFDTVRSWPADFVPPYPEVAKRQRDAAARRAAKADKLRRRDALLAGEALDPLLPSAGASRVAFLFPGQGSQVVGMLGECRQLPAVQQMLATARKVLGYDLAELCAQGPKDRLDRTEVSQPALFVAGGRRSSTQPHVTCGADRVSCLDKTSKEFSSYNEIPCPLPPIAASPQALRLWSGCGPRTRQPWPPAALPLDCRWESTLRWYLLAQ